MNGCNHMNYLSWLHKRIPCQPLEKCQHLDFSSETQKNPYAQHPKKSSGGGFEGVLLHFSRSESMAWRGNFCGDSVG